MLCELVAKGQIRRGLFDYIVDCPDMAMKAKPGQFLHVLCGGDTYLTVSYTHLTLPTN